MNDCILNLPAHVSTFDGRNDTFLRPLGASVNGEQYQIPAGSMTDGLSSPRPTWVILPPFGRRTWGPSAFHDAGYRGTLEKWDRAHSRWRKLHSTEYWDDQLLLHLLAANGVNLFMRYTIYYALRLFGWIAFKQDRKQAKLAARLFLVSVAALIMVGAGCVMSGAQPAPFVSKGSPPPFPPATKTTPAKAGTPNTEAVPASVTTNGITLVISADFHPGHAINGFFSASDDLKYWNVIDYFPYPVGGATVAFTNLFTEDYQFFRAGYDY